jgi:hypothetical protein
MSFKIFSLILFLPFFISAQEATSTISYFMENNFFPSLGQIISDLFPVLILIFGALLAIIFLKPFINFIKYFFK